MQSVFAGEVFVSSNRVAAVDRALQILDCFDGRDDRLSLAALHERTGLYKSTILRLAGSLEAYGYLNRQSDGRYALGPTLWRLGSLYRRRYDFADRVRPVLERLALATRESASFYVRDGDRRVCLFRRNGPQAIRHHLDEGTHLPLEQGAAGRLIRAFEDLGGADADAILERRHAVSLGERDPDTASIAVPVFNAHARFVGALVVSGLRSRFDEPARTEAIALAAAEAATLGPTLV
jgi:DNA-binding IclR family transcriptional regulator